MGQWASSAVTLEPIDFDGDSIVIEAERLKTADMSKLAGHFADGKLSFASQLELCQVAESVLPSKVKSINGMKKADGSPFSAEDFCGVLSEFYFTPLMAQILNQLIVASSVQNPKPLSPPSPGSSEA